MFVTLITSEPVSTYSLPTDFIPLVCKGSICAAEFISLNVPVLLVAPKLHAIVSSNNIFALSNVPLSISIPASLLLAILIPAPVSPLLSKITLSAITVLFDSTVVVVPSTSKLPLTITVPAGFEGDPDVVPLAVSRIIF